MYADGTRAYDSSRTTAIDTFHRIEFIENIACNVTAGLNRHR